MSELDALERLLARVSLSALGAHRLEGDEGCSLRSTLLDPRLIPAYASAVSLLLLVATALSTGHSEPTFPQTGPNQRGVRERINEWVKERGGWVIYAFNLARVLGTTALVGLTVAAVTMSAQPRGGLLNGLAAQIPIGGGRRWDGMWDCTGKAEVGLLVGYAYAGVLSLLAVTLKGPVRSACSFHASWILFIQFLVFFWRNVLPLTTFNGHPADESVQWLLWARGSLLAVVGLVIPALVPRQYVPFDPAHPAPNPAPEQTASILSFIFFVFMDPVVFAAWRVPQLPYEALPPLPDADWSDNLRLRAIDVLDPVRRREMGKRPLHLFFGLLHVFRWEYMRVACLLILEVLGRFLGPIGINRLLTYMERRGQEQEEEEIVRPWVWVLLIFLSPALNMLALNLRVFLTTRMVVQVESILVQVIFEHALRVRITDDSAISGSPASTSTAESLEPGASGRESATLVDTEGNADESSPASSSSTSPQPTLNGSKKGKESLTTEGGESTNKEPDSVAPPPSAKATHLAGKINNMFGTDIGNIIDGRDFLHMFLDAPLEVLLCMWFLWVILSWAAVVGMLFMLITLPIPGLLAGRIQDAQRKLMQKTDLRVQAVTESLGIIRMIKMFGWEPLVRKQIGSVRDEELRYMRLRKFLTTFNNNISGLLPMITMIITFAFYTLVMGKPLDAARVFSSIPVFDTLRQDMMLAMPMLTDVINAKVSLDRITDFLKSSQLLDRFRPQTPERDVVPASSPENNVIGFHKASFTWVEPTDGAVQAGQRNFRLQIDELIFKNAQINVIVGPTGCGKTSILMALLGEMHYQPLGVDSWFSLPRQGGIAYAAQESWVQNDTIKANILLGNTYDEERYKKVIYQCGLEPDLAMFTAGDDSEVGERGLTLSGGQKARVTLARAIYSPAQTLLLDDILSALDVHTARWVIDKCLQGDLIRGRTVLLVTHAVALAAPIAANVISVSPHGRIVSQGPLEAGLRIDGVLRSELAQSETAVTSAETLHADEQKPTAEKSAEGQLIVKEEMAEGRIRWASVALLTDAFGGPLYWLALSSAYGLGLACSIGAYEHPKGAVHVVFYLAVFTGIVFLQDITWLVAGTFHAHMSVKACRRIHDALCESVLGSTLRWIDTTPVGRIVSRFTQDIREIDGPLTGLIPGLVEQTMYLVVKFLVVIVVSPVFSVPGLVIVVLGVTLGQIYIAAQMCVKRLRSNWRSPMYNHLNAAVAGLVSVRAYGAEESFKAELRKRADAYARPSRTFYNLNRWINTRADLLGAAFSSGLAAYLLYVRENIGASMTGFSLTMAIEFSSMILWWVRLVNTAEVSTNSLERIRDYLVIEHEPPTTEKGKPPAYWPASGALRVVNLSARYSHDGPLVLQDISFEIKSGERIGIVGRTGSGKSSLALALLRLIPTSGKVYLDGLDTSELNLDALRKNAGIIPQEPTLISGTLRSNLNPYSEHDDATLYAALRATGLLTEVEGGRAASGENLTTDTPISHAGSNFSVGQRQLIALSRAIIRRTRVLILDEATASVDHETDALIQRSIRTELEGVTVITIAHRLGSVMDYDRIMVLDAGRLVELDTPVKLLRDEKSYFRALVEGSGDREKLVRIAEEKAQSGSIGS